MKGECAVVKIEARRYDNIPKTLVSNAKKGDIINIDIDKKRVQNVKKYSRFNEQCVWGLIGVWRKFYI